jgi:DNA-binding SARP family transcriptional activator/tetratricopeptide (TPR) repeat protein
MVRVRLVGDLELEIDGRRLEPIASRRARSLLAWLAYHPGLHTRSRVASVFWPDVLDSSARASLRTTLATLRRELGEEAGAVVVAERDRVGIQDSPDVWIDVREAARLAAAGDPDEALALVDGELLTDLDDDWVLEQRSAHHARVVELLTLVGDAAEAAGELEAAVRHARRRLELDPVSEDAARTLMRRLGRTGNGAAAVATYEAFRSTLRRELGMAPSPETRALAEELRAEQRGAVAPEPAPPLPSALVRSDLAPLVGRREQLEALRSAWRRASAGAAGVVMVAGEAGSGKTRLLIELAGDARASGATVLAGRCIEGGLVAFAPFTEALRQHLAGSPEVLPAWAARELARLLPELGPQAAPPQGDPQDARHRLFEAVAAAIGATARRAPVLLVVEDLHWADHATVAMLAHVIRTVGWAPVLVAGSLRAEREGTPELDALLDDLRREQRLAHVALAGLSESEADDLVAAWLGGRPPASLTEAVHGRTAGNPLFIEELVRHLVETHPERPVEALVQAATTDVPQGVRTVIDRRVARLPERARQAVTVAAILGEDFALADVAAACDASDDVAADDLEAAVGAGLIHESAQVAGSYRFGHALVRAALLAGLTKTRHALLHRRVAEVIDALPEDRREARLAELALHLLEAGPLVDAGKASGVALRAAEQATGKLAYEDAAELLRRAAASGLDDAGPQRAEILIALGDVNLRLGEAAQAGRCFEQAAGIARALGDAELLARAALGAGGLTVNVGPAREDVRALLEDALAGVAPASPLRPRLLARLAIEAYYARPVTVRERLSEQALAAGRRAGGRALLEALGARHVALWSPAHAQERLRIADELVAAARAAGDREAEVQGVNWRVTDLVELGDLAAARSAIDEHERLAGELRLLGYAWYVPMWRAMLALMAGRLDEARRLSEEGEHIGRAARDANAELLFGVQRRAIHSAAGELTEDDIAAVEAGAQSSPAAAAWRTWAAGIALTRGNRERARETILREVDGLATLPLDANWLYTAAFLGVRAAQIGEAAAAAAIYPHLLPFAHLTVTAGRASVCVGSVSLSLGVVAAATGDRDAAIAHLEEAVRRNDRIGAVPYAAQARHLLADLVDEARAATLRQQAEAAMGGLGVPLRDGLLARH